MVGRKRLERKESAGQCRCREPPPPRKAQAAKRRNEEKGTTFFLKATWPVQILAGFSIFKNITHMHTASVSQNEKTLSTKTLSRKNSVNDKSEFPDSILERQAFLIFYWEAQGWFVLSCCRRWSSRDFVFANQSILGRA